MGLETCAGLRLYRYFWLFFFLLAFLFFSSINSGAVHTTLLLLRLPFIGKCRQRIMTSLISTKALLNSTYEERVAFLKELLEEEQTDSRRLRRLPELRRFGDVPAKVSVLP